MQWTLANLHLRLYLSIYLIIEHIRGCASATQEGEMLWSATSHLYLYSHHRQLALGPQKLMWWMPVCPTVHHYISRHRNSALHAAPAWQASGRQPDRHTLGFGSS